ncbi:MAG: histidine phosphatase family protein [Bdellovibrionales bacterium]|nr:histidine phosphatase family protein [Bdellovibrionales bacterium]
MTGPKKLFLVRHAHRDNSIQTLDNGLSEKGLRQARAIGLQIAQEIRRRESDTVAVFSSPKKRCRETVEPLVDRIGSSLVIDPDLTEQGPEESLSEMIERISVFLARIREATDVQVFVACSHGDWLPLAARKLVGQEMDFRKGAWIEYELTGQGARVVQQIQEPLEQKT